MGTSEEIGGDRRRPAEIAVEIGGRLAGTGRLALGEGFWDGICMGVLWWWCRSGGVGVVGRGGELKGKKEGLRVGALLKT